MDQFFTDSWPEWLKKTVLVAIVGGLFMAIAMNI